MQTRDAATEPDQMTGPVDARAAPSMSSADLLQGGKVMVIRHGTEIYRLQLTRGGKLLLTK